MGKSIQITINASSKDVIFIHENGGSRQIPLYSEEGFREISRLWVDIGWVLKYTYTFTWLGRPLLQLPEDVLRIQELIYRIRPDVIVETGVAHGGSLLFYASLCELMKNGRVIGIDVSIRPANRAAIQAHSLSSYITLIEGSSLDPNTVSQVTKAIKPGETVMVMLDSCHTKEHVLGELSTYGSLVTRGSYIVAMDGIMEKLCGAPRTQPDWKWNNPRQAILEFAVSNPQFVIEDPTFQFNESSVSHRITYWPDAFLRRK